MKHKIITSTEMVHGIGLTNKEYAYLDSLFELHDDFDELTLFEGDPDYIKVLGGAGRGEIPFITVKIDDTEIYILCRLSLDHYGCEDEAKDIVEWFINGADNEIEIDNNWTDWDKVKKGIAYRGGSGYFYSLYAKELK